MRGAGGRWWRRSTRPKMRPPACAVRPPSMMHGSASPPACSARFWNAGHLLGSASVEMEIEQAGTDRPLRLLFSGDIGPDHKLLQFDPEAPRDLDYLICESTYGDRDRATASPRATAIAAAAMKSGDAAARGRSAHHPVLCRRTDAGAARRPVPAHAGRRRSRRRRSSSIRRWRPGRAPSSSGMPARSRTARCCGAP